MAGIAHSAAMLAVPGYDVAYDVIKNRRFTASSAASLGLCFVPGGPVLRIAGKVAAKTVGKVAIKTATKYIAPAAARASRAAIKRAGPTARRTYCVVATKVTKKPACFTAGTAVATAAGAEAIEEIDPGETVLARSEDGTVSSRTVLRTYESETQTLIHLTVAGETIDTTPSHPFWTQARGWTAAGALAPGDTFLLASGERTTLTATSRETLTAPVTVYNLEVESDHTYFVGAAGVWVHNVCGGNSPQGGVYALRTDRKVYYVGRTKNLERREKQWDYVLRNVARVKPKWKTQLNGAKPTFKTLHRTNSYVEQRGLEQHAYNKYRPKLNAIRPIARKNNNRKTYLLAARRFLNPMIH